MPSFQGREKKVQCFGEDGDLAALIRNSWFLHFLWYSYLVSVLSSNPQTSTFITIDDFWKLSHPPRNQTVNLVDLQLCETSLHSGYSTNLRLPKFLSTFSLADWVMSLEINIGKDSGSQA